MQQKSLPESRSNTHASVINLVGEKKMAYGFLFLSYVSDFFTCPFSLRVRFLSQLILSRIWNDEVLVQDRKLQQKKRLLVK